MEPYLHLLLLLLLVLLNGRGDGVPVAVFEDHRGSLCTSMFGKKSEGVEAAHQLCGLLWIEAEQPVNPATMMYLSTTDFNITAGIVNLRLWVAVGGVVIDVNETLEAGRWTKLCLGFRPSASAAATAAQHQNATTPTTPFTTTLDPLSPTSLFEVWVAVGERFVEVTEAENSHLSATKWRHCFGHFSVRNSSSFVGLAAAMSPVSGVGEIPATNTTCSEAVSAVEQSSWFRVANAFFIELAEQEVCSEKVHEITLYALNGYEGFRKMCRSLGGNFASVDEAMIEEIENKSCVTKDGYVSWLRGGGEEGEGTWSLCPALLANGTSGKRFCVQDLHCSKCRVPSALRYSLYGPVENFDREYSLRMLPDGSFYFQGSFSSNISWREEEWTLWSILHHRWWRLGQGTWPLGRRSWYSSQMNATLTFTSCNAIQFPTDDGTCLLRSQRCDGYQDYPDRSDEVGCRDRFLSKDRDYDKTKSPFAVFESGPISYNLQLINVDQITAAQGVAGVEFNLLLKWKDERLRFVDSKLYLNYFPCEEVWTPKLYLYAGYTWGPEANVSRAMSECYVFVFFKDEEVDVTDPLVGKITSEESQVIIRMSVKMHVFSTCQLKLSRYPFGRYTCNITMEVLPNEEVKWEGSFQEISYSRDSDLLDYHLDNVTLEPHGSRLTLTLHLSGLADYHLLGSFSPSCLMFIICYSTLYYPIGNFNERLMASLTSLLVLVALFSQTTASNVKTPYYKLLDVWYVVLVALCFLVVISNSVIHILNRSDRDLHTVAYNDDGGDDGIRKKRNVTRGAVWFNLICRYFLLTVLLMLIIVFVLIGKEYL